VKSKFIGTYKGYVNDNKITLKNVLYVPEFKKNLISIDGLSDQHYKTIFQKIKNKKWCHIYNKNSNRVCCACANNSNTYVMWTSKNKITFNNSKAYSYSSSSNVIDSLDMWHRRLGHFNIEGLKDTLPKINNKYKCKICAKSKLRNFPFYSNIKRASEPFELIHMDTVTISDYSLYGNKYILSILDDYSRFGWVIFLKSKGDVFNAFHNWFLKVKNIFNKSVKHLRTDNGTEFSNNNFDNFCNLNGIIHEYTVPYSPQQNGRIERLHGSLIPNARAMLEDAHLNHVFWEDAVATANFIYNRIPHKGINNNVPYELLYDEKVDFEKFRVFGCQVFFYVPKQLRNKLTNSALPGIFLGYDNNPSAFRIYDITNNKVVISRAVVFFEDSPGNCDAPSSSPDFINLTPYYENGGSDIDDDIGFHNNNNNISDNNNNNNINNNNIINNDNYNNNYNINNINNNINI